MSVIKIAQEVAAECGLAVPTIVSTSSKREHVELTEVINDAARHVGKAHEWAELTSEVYFTGTGTVAAFPMPSNFDRMKRDVKPWNTTTNLPLLRVNEPSVWHEIASLGYDATYQRSILMNNHFHIEPVLANGSQVRLYYQSNNLFISTANAYKAEFTADSDEFRCDERLLKLYSIAFWKKKNGQASSDAAMSKADALLNELAGTNMGNKEKSVVKAA